MNSVFPLYFQGEQCPDCLLDKEDWRISLAAANFLAKDFDIVARFQPCAPDLRGMPRRRFKAAVVANITLRHHARWRRRMRNRS